MKKSQQKRGKGVGFVLGRRRFASISAVEGIFLTREMKRTLSRFEREGWSAAKRRRYIIEKFKKAGS